MQTVGTAILAVIRGEDDIASAPLYPISYFPRDQFPPPSGAPAIYTAAPSPWNYEDLTQVTNKPPLQYAFQEG